MNVSGENIDELLASATKNGMYLVNDSNTDALEEEYEEGIITVDTLCEVVDPETTPFDSKYKARKLLDDLCNKLEATRTIASLEKKSDVIHRMNKKIGKAWVSCFSVVLQKAALLMGWGIRMIITVYLFLSVIENVINIHHSDPLLTEKVLTLWMFTLASARVRLGTISWECEEPHNAQVDLELAAEYYFGGFVANINDVVGSDAEHEVTDEGRPRH
jgi:hypothetical protein